METSQIRVQFASSFRQSAEDPRGEVDCPLMPSGSFLCQVPKAELDLRFAVDGFAPHYAWSIDLTAEDPVVLAAMTLRRGASLSGWLVLGSGEEPETWNDVAVTLAPLGLGTATDDAERRLRDAMTRVGRIAPNGFFQFDSLSGGEFLLTALGENFAESTVSTLLVEGKESQLREPLVLAPPTVASFVFDPPVDTSGQPWSVELSRVDAYKSYFAQVAEGQVPVDGWLDVPGLNPTTHMITVFDSAGQQVVGRFVDLEQESMPVQIEIGVVPVEGRVTLGDEPLVAELWFGGRYGMEKVRTATDSDGFYRATLPRDGDWQVDIFADDPPVVREFEGVEVEPTSFDAVVVDFALPDTVLSGTARHADGLVPRRGTLVYAFSDGGTKNLSQRIELDDAVGHFAFHGLTEGAVRVYAWASEAQSPHQQVTIREDDEVEVELILERQLAFQGRIMGEGRPIPGAIVMARPVESPLTLIPNETTDGAGVFEILLPADTRAVYLDISAPGRTLGAFRVSVQEGRVATIELPAEGGGLVVRGLPTGADPGEKVLTLYSRDRVPFVRYQMEAWASIHLAAGEGDALTLEAPNLVPGFYEVCRIPPERYLAWFAGERDPRRCVGGDVVPHGELTLELPRGED